jgi:hypothetical protein
VDGLQNKFWTYRRYINPPNFHWWQWVLIKLQNAADLPRTREALPQGGDKSAAMGVVEFVSFLCAVNYAKIQMFRGGKSPEGLLPPDQIFRWQGGTNRGQRRESESALVSYTEL